MSRRGRGEGSIIQRHDAPDCPPLIDGERAEHRCRGRWVAVLDLGWSAGKRRRKSVYGATKREVQDKLRDLRKRTPTARADHTVETWLRYWLEEIAPDRCRPQTLTGYRSKVNRYLVPLLGRHRLDALEPKHLRDTYREMRQRGLSEATLRQTHAILKRALVIAVREEQISRNVADMVEPPKTTKNPRRALTRDEAHRALTAAADDPYVSRWYAALWLGLRQGEALGLAWGSVDLDNAVLYVDRALVRVQGRLTFDEPKSKTSLRAVPIPPTVLAHLRVHHAAYVAEHGHEPPDDRLVWCQPNGSPIQPHRDWQAWRDLLRNAGVEHTALHAARNTAAQLMEAAGAPERLVMEILGHSQVQVTHRYQAGADLANRRKALESIDL